MRRQNLQVPEPIGARTFMRLDLQVPKLQFLIQRREHRAFEVHIHNESCRASAISSQMAAPGRPILAGCAEGMGEMAL